MQNTLKMATNTFLIAFSKTWASHWAQLGDHLAAAVGIAEKRGLWLRRGPFLDLPAGSWDVIIRTWNNRLNAAASARGDALPRHAVCSHTLPAQGAKQHWG